MDRNWNEELLSFIAASPFHACRNLAERLSKEGYTELHEQDEWTLRQGGRYFVRRNGSALIAFRIPRGGVRGFLMMAAHADSPSFKIKEHAAVPTAGMYTRLNVEKYGGMLCASWMDRPLSVAGRAAVRQDGRIVMKLVDIQRDLLLIPHVAIHMDRSANDGKWRKAGGRAGNRPVPLPPHPGQHLGRQGRISLLSAAGRSAVRLRMHGGLPPGGRRGERAGAVRV